jgi:hypothetical protein
MSLIIKQRSKTNVTIVSPTKVGRYEQGSDPLAQILRKWTDYHFPIRWTLFLHPKMS